MWYCQEDSEIKWLIMDPKPDKESEKGGDIVLLSEANNSSDILAWVTAWSDLIEFEVTPVMELEQVMQAIKGS
jgi:hypothetical protein